MDILIFDFLLKKDWIIVLKGNQFNRNMATLWSIPATSGSFWTLLVALDMTKQQDKIRSELQILAFDFEQKQN